jgi:3-methyladenine DNA glycosylase AlkD
MLHSPEALKPGRATTPAQAARDARRELARLARPAGSFDAARYFRDAGGLGFYNVGADRVRTMAKIIARTHADAWRVEDALAFADALISDRYLEVKGVGIETLACFRRQFTPKLLPALKRWLAGNHSSNWATTDAMCGTLIGPLLVMYPRLVPDVVRWSKHPNMWVRRASAVSLIPLARKGQALEAVYRVARTLHADREDLIQKAVGWTLREAGKADPVRLERYLRANGPLIPRTTLRYAIERFSPTKRQELLRVTRGR